MRKYLIALSVLFLIGGATWLFSQGPTITPNIGLQIPAYQQTNWQVPYNFDLAQLDLYLSDNLAIPTLGYLSFRSLPGPIHSTGNTASIPTSTLCPAITAACGQAGQYKIHFDFIETGSACTNVTAGSVTLALTWIDTNGTAHSGVVIPMLNQTGATSAAIGNSFTFATVLANAGASGDFVVATNGSVIQYSTFDTACTSGTGTYQLDAATTRLQ